MSAPIFDCPNDYLLLTLVHMARADGQVVPMEVVFIEGVMKVLDVSDATRRHVKAMLRGSEEAPPIDFGELDIPYERKLDVFREAIQLAFSDEVFAAAEQALIGKLVNKLGLHPGDMQRIWDRSKHHYPHAKE